MAQEFRSAPSGLPQPQPGPADAEHGLAAPGLWRRMACWLYEGMLLFAVVFVSGFLFSTLTQMRDAMNPLRPLLQGFLFVVFGTYFTWFWAKGQTLAMKTWRIRVVDVAGRPISQARALLRYLCSWLWFLPPLIALAPLNLGGAKSAAAVLAWVGLWALLSRLHPQRQFWHDALAGTRLVAAQPPSR
jgi:uncharacterized RDD family membrane protein YckC